MPTSFRVFKPFRESEIDQENSRRSFSSAYQKVLWLDVSVNESLRMQVLQPIERLNCEQCDCFRSELSLTEKVQGFYTWTKHIHHHHIEITLCSEVLYLGETLYHDIILLNELLTATFKDLVDFRLIL